MMKEIQLPPATGKIIVFYCDAALRGPKLEEIKKLHSDVSFIELSCCGRLNPVVAFKALMDGAGGVIVYSCPDFDCHHFDGNFFAKRRFHAARGVAEALGVDPTRIEFVQRKYTDMALLDRNIASMKRNLERMGV
jgi:coenzyme F420-reducing hydrogenase delta subunit